MSATPAAAMRAKIAVDLDDVTVLDGTRRNHPATRRGSRHGRGR